MSGRVEVVRDWDAVEGADLPPLLVLDPLQRLLDDLGLGSGPLHAEPLGEGHSNVTFLLRREGAAIVLRRPPRPPYPASAHDVIREAQTVAMLGEAGARVPKILAIHDDPATIGAPFYLMSRLSGYALTEQLPPGLDSLDAKAAIGSALVDALVELHAIDLGSGDLRAIGRPDGYLERQLKRFADTWDQVATRSVPEIATLHEWLTARRPASPAPTVVHGDYRLGNVLLAAGDPLEVSGILDWEMATVGDPLADVGYMLAAWADPDDPPTPMRSLSRVTRSAGFSRRADLRVRYAERSGRDLSDIGWYEVLALWKSAVFLEANYRRYLAGTMHDDFYSRMDEGVPQLARAGMVRIASLEDRA